MVFYFLDEYSGEKEVVVDNDSIIVKYEDNSEIKGIKLNYADMQNISFTCEVDHYIFDIIMTDVVVTFSLNVDNKAKIREWLKMYKDIMSYLPKYYSIDNIEHKYTQSENTENIGDEFYINIISDSLNKKSKSKLTLIGAAIFLATFVLLRLTIF